MKHIQTNSRPQIVEQNATTIWSSQEVLNFLWTIKPYPQYRTPQPYQCVLAWYTKQNRKLLPLWQSVYVVLCAWSPQQ